MLTLQFHTAFVAALSVSSVAGYSHSVAGNFSNPLSSSRPSFRYWLPDASADGKVVKEDIGSVAQIGGGGVEFVPFYEYGGIFNVPPPGISWSKYAFGTKYYNELFRTALEAHHENDLLMDFSLGPNQGQGVPSSPEAEGLQWDLVSLILPSAFFVIKKYSYRRCHSLQTWPISPATALYPAGARGSSSRWSLLQPYLVSTSQYPPVPRI